MSDTLMECAAVVVQNPIVRGLFIVFVGLLDLVIGRWYAPPVAGSPPSSEHKDSEAVRAQLHPNHEHFAGSHCVRRGVFLVFAAALVLLPILAGCSRSSREPALSMRIDGEPTAPSRAEATIVASGDVEPEGEAAELARIGTTERVKTAAVEASARVDEAELAARTRLAARTDFAASVKRWTGFALVALAGVGVAALVGSMLPFGATFGLEASDAAYALAGVIVLSMVRYALLAWGIVVADAAVIVCIALVVVAGLAVGLPLGYGWYRRRVWHTYWTLSNKNDEARAATAVWAIAANANGEGERDKQARAATLQSHTHSNQHYYAARRGPESQA